MGGGDDGQIFEINSNVAKFVSTMNSDVFQEKWHMPYDLEEFYNEQREQRAKEREKATKEYKHPWTGKDEGTHGY